MKIITDHLPVATKGHTHIIDITAKVAAIITRHGFSEGQVTVFNGGSTGGITTIEFEPGLLQDLPEAYEKLAPSDKSYHHDLTWGDGNGSAHVRAALQGPSLTIPFTDGKMLLGTWQQIVFIDFDNRSRSRNLTVQIIGE